MSHRTRIRRLEREMDWLRFDGKINAYEMLLDMFANMKKIQDRDPALAARFGWERHIGPPRQPPSKPAPPQPPPPKSKPKQTDTLEAMLARLPTVPPPETAEVPAPFEDDS